VSSNKKTKIEEASSSRIIRRRRIRRRRIRRREIRRRQI
jgi:hypothetical protein